MSRPTAYRKSFEDAAASRAILPFASPAGSGPARSFGSTCKAPMTFASPRTEREMKSRGYQFVPMPRDGRQIYQPLLLPRVTHLYPCALRRVPDKVSPDTLPTLPPLPVPGSRLQASFPCAHMDGLWT